MSRDRGDKIYHAVEVYYKVPSRNRRVDGYITTKVTQKNKITHETIKAQIRNMMQE